MLPRYGPLSRSAGRVVLGTTGKRGFLSLTSVVDVWAHGVKRRSLKTWTGSLLVIGGLYYGYRCYYWPRTEPSERIIFADVKMAVLNSPFLSACFLNFLGDAACDSEVEHLLGELAEK